MGSSLRTKCGILRALMAISGLPFLRIDLGVFGVFGAGAAFVFVGEVDFIGEDGPPDGRGRL